MKKRIITFAFVIIMLFAVSVTAFAANPEIAFESAYNAESGLVNVTIYVDNAQGLQASDLSFAFDPEMYEFVSYEKSEIEDGMIIAANIEGVPGLCTCSVIFMEKCEDSDLDSNGRLKLVTYTFKPVDDEYDINEFCLWASSFDVNDSNIYKSIKTKGNEALQEEKTDLVTMPETTKNTDEEKTTKKGTESASMDIKSKWYVYLIAGVLAVGAIAGIAFVAIKSSHNENNSSEGASDKKDSQEKE